MKQRILIISEGAKPNIGGVETHVDDLQRYLRKQGNMVTIIAYQPLITNVKAPRRETADNLEIRRVSWLGRNLRHRLEQKPALIFLYIFPGLFFHSLLYMLRNHARVDVIHAHGLIAASIAGPLARLFGKRAVLTPHTIFRLDERKFLSTILKPVFGMLDAITVIAPGGKAELVKIGIPEDKVKNFTHWVDLDVFKPLDKQECRRRLSLPDRFTFLFVGRFHEQKNVRLLLETAAKMPRGKVAFVFVGLGHLEQEIKAAQRENSDIFLVGPMDNRELPVAYSVGDWYWADLDVDYLSLVTIESYGCGTPAIAPGRIKILGLTKEVDAAAFREPIDLGILKLVEPEAEALARTITDCYNRQSEAQTLSQRCRQFALKYHSERNAEIITDAYQKAREKGR